MKRPYGDEPKVSSRYRHTEREAHELLLGDRLQEPHRQQRLGIGLAGLVLWLWDRARRSRANVAWRARIAIDSLFAATLVQIGLGIATLLTQVAVPLAVLHQLGALVIFTLALWTVYELGTSDAAAPGALRANSNAPTR